MSSIFSNKRREQNIRGVPIPNGWKTYTLYEVRDKNDRYSFTGGPFGSDLKTEHYTNRGVRVIQLQNIGDGKFLDDYKLYTSEEKADELFSCNIFPGEIIIAKMAEPLARACIIPNTDSRFLMASDGIRLKVDKHRFDTYFILNLINSWFFRKEAIKRGTGTTRMRIGLSDLKNIKIFAPTLPEQKAISKIIYTWDKAIELKEKLIEQKKEQKKGLMQKLLTGEVRLPGFSGEWEKEILQNVAKVIMGQSPPSSSYNENQDGFPLIQGNNDCKNRKTSPKIWTSKPTKMCRVGDIIMTVRAPVGIISRSVHEACIGRGVCAIRSNINYVYQDFLYYQLIHFENMWGRISQGSTFEAINSNDIKGLKVKVPSIEEQVEISKVLLKCDQELDLYEKELNALKQQKKGLMQQLLTGKIRVKV